MKMSGSRLLHSVLNVKRTLQQIGQPRMRGKCALETPEPTSWENRRSSLTVCGFRVMDASKI
jgi:hypothetical protein